MKKTILVSVFIILAISSNAQGSFASIQKGLKFEAEDKSALVKMSFRSQNLFTYDNNFDNTDLDVRMMVRRMRLKFSGYLLDPKYEYKLELGFSNRDIGNSSDASQVSNGSKMVLDAVLKYHLGKKQELWFGQTKLPGNRERVISSQALQFVDRSLVNSRFNIDRDFGVQYRLNERIGDIPVKLGAAISLGEGRNITAGNVGGFAYTGRLEFYPMGSFKNKGDYFGADLEREESPKLAIGGTYSLNNGTSRTRGQLGSFQSGIVDSVRTTITGDLSTAFIDLMFKYKGWSVMSEFATSSVSNINYDSLASFSIGNGFVVQAGYLFEKNYELAARYTSVNVGTNNTDLKSTNEYTLCFSKYIVGHKLKCQTDISLIGESDYRFRFQIEFGI